MLAAPEGAASRVAVAGARGFLGRALVARLRAEGHQVITIGRPGGRESVDVEWVPAAGRLDARPLAGVRAVVNLAGETIAQRWTAAARRRILDSRVQATSLLARACAGLEPPPDVFVSMSAVGIYGDRGDEVLDESRAPGTGFLADVVRAWEAAAEPARAAGLRVVHLRTGVVLHPSGGALAKMLPVFRLGLGGRIGSGRQWLSWIALPDAARALAWLATGAALDGAINVTSPNPVRNAEFTRVLARVLGRPAVAVIPPVAIRGLFGQMGEETLLAGQRVLPRRLLEAGFRFHEPDLEPALRRALGRP